ncbi:MAG: ABC transporter permease [Actinomycetota bacterium]
MAAEETLLGGVGALRERYLADERWARRTLYAGVVIVGILTVVAVLAPLIATHSPTDQNLTQTFRPPSREHLMGTDNLGRDVFSRVVFATRIDLQIGLLLTYVPFVFGVILGAVAGYFGRWVDTIIMRLVDVVIAFPFLVLIIAFLAVFGPGVESIYVAVFIVGWSMYARLSRAEMLVLKEQEFMLAAQALGYSRTRIIFRHAIPNLLGPNLVFSMADFVLNILLVASLSFLGLGVQPPTPEWGAIVADGRHFLVQGWWIATLPGLVIVFAGVGFSLIGDGLSERLGKSVS